MVQSSRLRWILLDRYRLLRSVVVGVLISVPLAFLISPREALALHWVLMVTWSSEPPGG